MPNKFLNHLPHTEFGAKMNLTEEQEKNCKVVYRLSEEEPDVYVFDGLWDSEATYPDECIIVPLRSTAVNKSNRPDGYIFSNVIDSKNDPKPHDPSSEDPKVKYSNWLKVFEDNGINYDGCKTDGNFYSPKDDHAFTPQEAGKTELTCNSSMVGGHVIPGKIAQEVQEGENVELIPICSHHNSYAIHEQSEATNGNGTGFYMKLEGPTDILELIGYFRSNDILEKNNETID